MKNNVSAILLAAGECSRFWPLAVDKHKSMYEIMGKPVIQYTIEGLSKTGITEFVIVNQPKDDSIKSALKDGSGLGVNIKYSVQNEPLGMGNAVLSAKENIKSEMFFVLNADQVNAGELAKDMLNTLEHNKNADAVLASQQTETPFNYGILEIENGIAKGIEEKPEKGTEKSNQMVVGIYMLNNKFMNILENTETSQYSYEEALDKYIKQYKSTAVKTFENIPEITLKFPWHIFTINKYLMNKYLKNIYMHNTAKVSPNAIIEGNVHIGERVRIFENAVIKGPCYINEGAVIGNNSLVRDYSYVGRNTIIGFNTEIKNSIIYDKVETHMNYIGDSIIDEGTGFGAGSITANRRLDRGNITTLVKKSAVNTGMTFFGCITGKNVHTGIHTGIMPGVKIGPNSNIGANTNLTKDVPNNTFIYAKQQIINKKSR